MNIFSAVAFGQPLILWALLSLPVIWWLLRMTPPRPRRLVFPPLRLLLGLEKKEETPATSPWWLTALRILIATLIILALAAPVLRPDDRAVANASGPLVIFIDNGWAAGADWEDRQAALSREISAARDEGRAVMLVPTAASAATGAEPPQEAMRVAERVAALQPLPYAPDRAGALEKARAALPADRQASIVWIADGLDHGEASAFITALETFAAGGSVDVVMANRAETPLALGPPRHDNSGVSIDIMRAGTGAAVQGQVRALAFNGRSLGEAPYSLAPSAREAEARIALPLELTNEIARIELTGVKSAGAVKLLDDRWRLPRVGLVTGESQDISQPLLSPLYYVERALAPYSDLRRDAGRNLDTSIADLVAANVGTIVMTDVGVIPDDAYDALSDWVERGGVLVRFAGPRLAAGADDLVPVGLRQGGRTLGGTLSWSDPQTLGPFADSSPFAGLAIPPEVTVNRQVLAEPGAGLSEKSWAQLADGTPLVTGAKRERGWLILFHVTANASWSNLPLSGLFVQMLRKITDFAPASLGSGAEAAETGVPESAAGNVTLQPYRTLDGRGALAQPPATAVPIISANFDKTVADRQHPPGYYGPAEAPRALNTLAADATLTPLGPLPQSFTLRSFVEQEAVPLKPWLLLAALLILALDGIIILVMSGARLLPRRAATAAGIAFAVMLAVPGDIRAQTAAPQPAASADEFALRATLETRLAFVVTGKADIDRTSERGLAGLTRALAGRTALEAGEPIGVDVSRDELAFFPLLYWPVDPNAAQPDADTLARIDAYMKQGGTILFDTRDQASGTTNRNGGPGMERLQGLLANIDVPALEPVPADHVLTKAFYLLQAFPGRWDGGAMWVETTQERSPEDARPVRRSDGVSSILITSNDLAAAWAEDENQQPIFPVVPGGERQREMAMRSGINIVMYTLTGNYKADQVHVPALLERLGQ